ncbi:hypothetical protein NIES2135_62090 (plasmid) [Leptolyngbya boryana NIES-2135]|jgi:hypothetical protein|uniref:Uncharacterized protein n=1 Tax=Leptolyngbya boryana NIES-2135 TaxID=1973484 RepID=A0A1Z4JRH5_LEPBY|nr:MULTISPECIES: hypothetical protein [Leptolyngbya]BAY59332.1 hypothetical protein NIES2135_62090 [Leptolyngbya boryana NIES-2135]MBD2372921.1 hypothetical protein [Leptolyngbya sp. FACHB-238]MBD2397326.1 hypothetical protein [Leptolyngbya sp. FACHB-239]MBD2403869.1 hypothetical protein [Leptolyngbya sp. FACHB-402]ULP33166.1 hypothetical protein MCP04_30820 [Leptolyngbya boryana IU 594]
MNDIAFEQSPYESFLNFGTAWCPTWSERSRGFHWNLVLAPPRTVKIEFEDDYCLLLVRRVEWHLQDWIEQYGDEMGVDPRDREVVKQATLQLIEARLGIEQLDSSMSDRAIATAIVKTIQTDYRTHLFPHTLLFPVTTLRATESRDFADCIRSEITFDGWILEAIP